MISRIASVFFVVMLTIPVITATQHVDTSPSPWEDIAVAAKGKSHHGHKQKHKKHDQEVPLPPVTRTVRQPVTKTFTSTERISIPDDSNMGTATFGKGNPYPSTIDVSGFTNGVITDVNLILNDFAHASPPDVDLLLTENGGRQALVMSDISSVARGVTDVDLTLDDEAPKTLRSVTSGTFRPNDIDRFDDTFDAPAPALTGDVDLTAFDGANPNGTWQLWAMDNASQDVGAIGGGWSLEITAEVDVQVQEPAPNPDEHKDKKHHKQIEAQRGARRQEG